MLSVNLSSKPPSPFVEVYQSGPPAQRSQSGQHLMCLGVCDDPVQQPVGQVVLDGSILRCYLAGDSPSLLQHMSQFMSQEPLSGHRAWRILSRIEHDMVAHGVS